jgi:hypothetical protein
MLKKLTKMIDSLERYESRMDIRLSALIKVHAIVVSVIIVADGTFSIEISTSTHKEPPMLAR